MKPVTPHDPLDDLIAAALHGELTPEERTQFDARLRNEPATQAAYQKAQLMHDLLEKTHRNAQPDTSFEQRMVSGVRRKIKNDEHKESSWESLLVLWTSVKRFLPRHRVAQYGIMLAFVSVVSLSVLISMGNQVKGVFTTISSQLAYAGSAGNFDDGKQRTFIVGGTVVESQSNQQMARADEAAKETTRDLKKVIATQGLNYTETAQKGVTMSGYVDKSYTEQFAGKDESSKSDQKRAAGKNGALLADTGATTVNSGSLVMSPTQSQAPMSPDAPTKALPKPSSQLRLASVQNKLAEANLDALVAANDKKPANGPTTLVKSGEQGVVEAVRVLPDPIVDAAPAIDTRKLIRNAQLDLEVKSYQAAVDQITALTKAAGGYVDTSNSQKGGNGKLQGTVVVKVLPQNLDSFLVKLRDLGQLRNQSISTDDVTKEYIDMQARLENSRKMEAQLQDLLKRTNGKVSELLQVERELGRVRGEIEQMQGQLKLYDFQVQYATVTMNMRETDLNQAAAYLLKETDDFSLFATDVEGAFQQTRKAADDFKAHILTANLNHNSGSDVAALLVVSVPPDQIESFLAQLRILGRVANFTRQTQRVAKDGGETDQPADQTLTDKDKVIVNITIKSDDESRKQVATTVVTSTVDTALDQAKAAALADSGEILSSSLNKTPQGQSTAELSVRIPGKNYHALLDTYKTLGRTASFSLQREDNSGPGVNGDDEPVIVSLSLTDEESPLQETAMSVLATNVDDQAQQLKRDAASYGVQVKASSFEREPSGIEMAQMTFRMPMSKYASFVESLKKLGRVEALTVTRVDRPDQSRTDDTAPAELTLRLHNQGDIVAADDGLWATLRQTFGEGAGALFGSIKVIGVMVAFIIPWAIAVGLIAWIGRRIYLWKKK